MRLPLPPDGAVNNLGANLHKIVNIYEHVTSVCRAAILRTYTV